MKKHFKLTSETKVVFGITLFRIELTVDCKWGKVGDKGGWVEKDTNVIDNAWVSGNAQVYGNARIFGDALVYDNAQVSGDAQIINNNCICLFSYFGSSNRTTTFFKLKCGGIGVVCGCFYGDLKAFKKQVKERHKDNKYAREYLAMIKLVEIKFKP